MLEVIYGKRGSGKTKTLIAAANTALKDCSGDVVYIDDDNRCILDLNHDIRFMNASEYDIMTTTGLRGFICGVLASDYDIKEIFIDGFPKIVGCEHPDQLEETIAKIDEIGKKHNIKITISISGEKGMEPDFIKEYIK